VADTTDDSLFREIDEELRQEKFTQLWNRYGRAVIAGAVALVLAVGGFQGWKAYDIKSRSEDGERFARALGLPADGGSNASYEAFVKLSGNARSGYALLSRFQAAALLAKQGERDKAVAAYDKLATDGGIDAIYQGLAVILRALLELDTADPDVLGRRLAPLTADDSPWRFSAKEISALLAQRSGDTARARSIYTELANDAAAPQGIRARAGEMLLVLGK